LKALLGSVAEVGFTAVSCVVLTCKIFIYLLIYFASIFTYYSISLVDHIVYVLNLRAENKLSVLCSPNDLGGRSVRHIACGEGHVLLATDGGQLYAYGSNKHGEVNDNTNKFYLFLFTKFNNFIYIC